MSRALIYCANTNAQTLAENGIISPGFIVRRYGCAFAMNGDAVSARGEGYYNIIGTVTVAATEAGPMTVTLYDNGVPIPGSTATATVAAADNVVTLPIIGTIRKGCCDNGISNITAVLATAGTVQNFALRVEKA